LLSDCVENARKVDHLFPQSARGREFHSLIQQMS
jgi:hypothetical protein